MTNHPATTSTSTTGRPVTRYYQPAATAKKRHRVGQPAVTATERARGHSVAFLGYLCLAGVVLCVGAMSWTGLVGFARDTLGLTEPLCYGVPIALDGSAMTLAFFALRSVLSGGAAGLPRLLAVLTVIASSGFNYYHARESGQGGAAEVFFAGMSILVYVMFETVLRYLRRQHLQAVGAVEPPLARFRLARWLRFPWRTFKAWSAAVAEGLTDPAEALAFTRGPAGPLPAEPTPEAVALIQQVSEETLERLQRQYRRELFLGRLRLHRIAATEAGVAATLTLEEWEELLEEHGHACTYCKEPEEDIGLHMEHVIPLSRGGPFTKENIRPACRRCNAQKGTRTSEEFAAQPVSAARARVQELLAQHGDSLNRAIVMEATGVKSTRAGQLIREERAQLAAGKRRNGSTP